MKVQRFLDGVAIQFYRGIGPEMQKIGPFKEMNFFIGANNAGKSIVLKFIHERLPFSRGREVVQSFDLNSVDAYRGQKTGRFAGAVGIDGRELIERNRGLADTELSGAGRLIFLSHLDEMLGSVERSIPVWFSPDEQGEPKLAMRIDFSNARYSGPDVWNLPARKDPGDRDEAFIKLQKRLCHEARSVSLGFPPRQLIPAKRELGGKDQEFTDLSGKGLIDELARLQSPDFTEQAKRVKFDAINRFLQEVTGKANATIDVPHDRNHLLVHIDDKVLPLQNLGTGIHEVVLIAAFCTIHQDQIICIEEPEIHLHPHLQRKLMAYLRDNTTNQYFIATHSAALIDTEGAAVFRVRNDGVQTYVEPALGRADGWRICEDLGYRASDILQANMVIWVEGPSDRIYLKHWIDATREGLVEGIHYTILFYGGGLVSHLSAEADVGEDIIRELVDLRGLSAHMAIVMDSDRAAEGDDLKPAVQRLVSEVALENEGEESPRSMVWVTAGREIENYVPHGTLQAALKQRHPVVYGKPLKEGPFEHAFHFERKDGEEVYTKGDKVGAAKIVCERPADLDILDLKARIAELVALICRANTLSG